MSKDRAEQKKDLLRIMEYTQMNLDCMWKRLNRKAHFASLILVYYSMSLIIYSLTLIVFREYYHEALSSYFNIILSIIVLIYSLENRNARYSERIQAIKSALDALKDEKRNLSLDLEEFETAKKKYEAIIKETDYREDIDFFATVKLLCKKNDINWWTVRFWKRKSYTEEQERIIGYLNQMNPYYLQFQRAMEMLIHVILTLIPLAIFIICILAKVNGWFR